MKITTQHIKYFAIAAGLIAIIAYAADRYYAFHVGRLETAVAESARAAETQSRRAAGLENEAAAYREKVHYLEDQISQISEIARKQDEQIKANSRRVTAVRGDVERARNTRSIDVTNHELCKKLAELGHGCE